MNVCPICRNVNQRDATVCRYCGATLTPPVLESVPARARRRRWPFLTAAAALVVVGAGGISLFSGGAAAPQAVALEVGTGEGASLQFEPTTVTAPANTPVQITFINQSTLPHNLTFQNEITARTVEQVAAAASETISFETPGAGTYPFVCTIHPGMEGALTVQ
jgi:plastocyanin